ncbi:MAG: CDP-glycerol glycerophosphotransferase family protein, partial [Clostridia bacterium]|nr:CDP-glycerol glycerophosphotransferase family protein [Clostridia bacterium]
MKKPAFLFAPDLKAFTSERDFYTDIHSWPFPLSESNEELKKIIVNFDQEKYALDVDRHHKELGSYET